MTDTHREPEREADPDIGEIAARLGRLSLTPAPSPSLSEANGGSHMNVVIAISGVNADCQSSM